MKKIFITGCCGFIGRNLTARCIELGHEVIGIDDYSTTDRRTLDVGMLSRFRFLCGDMIAFSTLEKHISGCDVVVHLAARARVQPSMDDILAYNNVNVTGTLKLLYAMNNVNVRNLVFSSSSSVYGDNGFGKFKETDLLRPTSPYAIQKMMGEQYIAWYTGNKGFNAKILRFFNVYGAGMITTGKYIQAVQKFLNDWREGQPFNVYGDGQQIRDFTHVDDVVDAILLAIDHDGNDTFNIGADEPHSIQDVCELVGGEDWPVRFLPAKSEPSYTCADNSKARKLLGWKPQRNLADWIFAEKERLRKFGR